MMTSFKTLALAALLSAVAATPVFAQAAIQEPGEFAFYHPNLDVLNGGAPIDTAPPEASMAHGARESGIFPQYRAYGSLHRYHRHRHYRE